MGEESRDALDLRSFAELSTHTPQKQQRDTEAERDDHCRRLVDAVGRLLDDGDEPGEECGYGSAKPHGSVGVAPVVEDDAQEPGSTDETKQHRQWNPNLHTAPP